MFKHKLHKFNKQKKHKKWFIELHCQVRFTGMKNPPPAFEPSFGAQAMS